MVGRYSLVEINRNNEFERHFIKFYCEELGKDISSVRLQDIDCFTSSFENSSEFENYLRKNGMGHYDTSRYCIVTTYDEKEYYFKVIFNSPVISRIANKVNASYVTVDDDYRSVIDVFRSYIREPKFLESVINTTYFKKKFKDKIVRYIELVNNNQKDYDEFEEERKLWLEISEEFKRYKTFRGLYLFIEVYKKYGYVEKNEYHNNNKEQVENTNNNNTNQSKMVGSDIKVEPMISNADDYNKEYDEFLSDEEFNDAYGEGNATQYTKGARHD